MHKAACHIHTHHSYDSMTSPQTIVETAVKNQIDYLLICDHDSWEGSIKAWEYARKKEYPITIPLAAEVFTDIGDIIVVGCTKTFPLVKNHKELYKAVKEFGGYTILPHPFDGHSLERLDFNCVDVIEVFNSRSQPEKNRKAVELAKTFQKPHIYGSDAHFQRHFSNAIFMFEGTPPYFRNACPMELTYTSQKEKKLTQVIKGLKKRDLLLFLRSLKSWFLS